MKERVENTSKRKVRKFFCDPTLRAFTSSTLSCLFTSVFAGYNIFLAIAYKTVWNGAIAAYYLIVAAIKAYILLFERKLRRTELSEEQVAAKRQKAYLIQSIFLFAVDLALIFPVSLMVMQRRSVDYSMIPAIAAAAYTTYKIILSTRGFVKSRKHLNLSLRTLKKLNFMEMLVSMLSLQYIMVMTFGGGFDVKMKTLCAISSFVVWSFVVTVSAFSLAKAVKLKK